MQNSTVGARQVTDQLRSGIREAAPRVIGIVSGSDRSPAILAAIRGGLIKSLVIDECGAGVLLAAASSHFAATTAASSNGPGMKIGRAHV